MAQRTGLRARGTGGPRRHAVGHLLLQLLAVPVHARQLGHQAALPDHADPPAGRAADAPRRARRHHLRLGRQDRPVHRPPRRQADAAAARLQRRTTTTWARSWSAPTRRSWATCTTCSATPTPCTCSLDDNGEVDPRRRDQGRHRARSARLRAVSTRRAWSRSCAATWKRPCGKAASATRNPAACCASTKKGCTATPTWKAGISAASRNFGHCAGSPAA